MKPSFQLVEPDDVVIDGVPAAGMTIRAAGRALGRLRGFIVDSAEQHVRDKKFEDALKAISEARASIEPVLEQAVSACQEMTTEN